METTKLEITEADRKLTIEDVKKLVDDIIGKMQSGYSVSGIGAVLYKTEVKK